ncbi:MAG: 1-acyl-sn-glycerol-3-phosphate acyltransferase [Hamadaea sp.]|uniref:lysophospholipid acyltransferase family protein n=1 Tax=Hamadaea sp. TaxID=2024425 RepID=UPI0017EE6B4D|nr:lysophospholipid acyltransferase family protein [Hamadaea sp.]NUR74056.1 1-acyl-sn-glycerol-3-phosphate acyltransferase [Hamadaea sp.]NUT22657.1 1-acyl-sn-glycerol-3-phosphate acyltransferase [Hamadaea sp.]
MSFWRPEAGCGPHCLPGDTPQVGFLRYVARLVGAAAVLAFAAVAPARPATVQAVARALLRVLGLDLRVRGKHRPGLLVANHVSWVDIVVLMAVTGGVRLVAKKEVGEWPVIGRLARRQHAVFVDRARPRQLPAAVAEAAAGLRAGATVAVFPEATTTCGACPVPMRPAFFQAAIDAGVPVTPLTLTFSVAGERSAAAAFVGDETLIASVRRLARAKGLTLTVSAAAPLFPEPGADRRVLARAASATVAATPIFTRLRRPTPAALPTPALSR